MSTLLTQVLIYMVSTFILGVLLGWVVWSQGAREEKKALTQEVKFWKNRLDQKRFSLDPEITEAEGATKSKKRLKRRFAKTVA